MSTRAKRDPRVLTPEYFDVLRQELLGGYYESCGGHGCTGGDATATIRELLAHIEATTTDHARAREGEQG